MVSSNCWPSSKHVFPATGDILLFCYPTTRHDHLLDAPSGLWQIATGVHYISTWVSAAVHRLPTYHPPSSPHHPAFSKCLHQHMGSALLFTICSLAIVGCPLSARLPSSAIHHLPASLSTGDAASYDLSRLKPELSWAPIQAEPRLAELILPASTLT